MSDHCVHSHRTHYLLHFNFEPLQGLSLLRWGPHLDSLESIRLGREGITLRTKWLPEHG